MPEWSFHQALRKYLEHYQASYGIDTELHLPEQSDRVDLNPEVGVQVMRVIQEAMTNASRHGGARRVEVAFSQKDTQIQISISDDGRGFDPENLNPDAGKHFGLMFMRERMSQIGGSVLIESQPGSGTTVFLDVPLGK